MRVVLCVKCVILLLYFTQKWWSQVGSVGKSASASDLEKRCFDTVEIKECYLLQNLQRDETVGVVGGEINPSPLPESVQKYSKIAGNKFSWKLAVIFK